MIILMLLLQEWTNSSTAAIESAPELVSKQIKWQAESGLYINKNKFVALGNSDENHGWLSNELYSLPTSNQENARKMAAGYIGSLGLTDSERYIVGKSELTTQADIDRNVKNDRLGEAFSNVGSDWWLEDHTDVAGYTLGRYVTKEGVTSASVKKAVSAERESAGKCVTQILSHEGYALSYDGRFPDAGEEAVLVEKTGMTCRRTIYDAVWNWRTYSNDTCTGEVYYERVEDRIEWQVSFVGPDFDRCLDAREVVVGVCYNTDPGWGIIFSKVPKVYGTRPGTSNSVFPGREVWERRACDGPKQAEELLGIRPKVTLNPTSIIIESIPVLDDKNNAASPHLKEYISGNDEMLSGTDYKLRLFDATQNIQKVSKPSIKQDDLFDVKDTTIQIEKGTTQVTLDTTVNGTHNYISAMATDIDNNTTLYGKIGEHTGNGNTTSITLDLSNIMDTSKPGTTKQVNLYSEQINGDHESDLVSSKPLTVTFEVLEPRKEQKLSFDENNAREMMYGDTITLKAKVNDADTTKGWAADTDPVFALVGDPTASPVTLENPQFDTATGIATVTLKARNVDAAEVTLSLNKAGSDAQPVRYEKADEITTTIKINKRAITVTPKKVILGIGDAYPPIWEFDTAMTDTSNKVKALVDGDVLPYTVKTSALESDQSDEPVLDQDNKITIANKAKKWGLSVSNEDPAQAAAIEAFEKKYDVKKNDYDGINNKKSRLEISSIRYDGIEFIKHPDDVTTLDEETFTFTAVATYPTKTIDDKDVPLDEQSITYQWQYSEDGKDWKDIPDDVGTPTADYKDGEATFTYTKTAEIADTKKQYRCTAKNKRDVEDGVTAMSNPAGLFVTMEPLTFIQIPQSVELVEDKNREFAKNKTADEANAIKLNEYKNTVSENKETTQQVPEGEFKIYVQTPFYLTLNKDEKQHDKKYQVTVTDANDKTLTTKLEADKYLLTSLSYKNNKKQDTFILKTPVDRKKTVGTYTGDMVFTIQYVKPSGGS